MTTIKNPLQLGQAAACPDFPCKKALSHRCRRATTVLLQKMWRLVVLSTEFDGQVMVFIERDVGCKSIQFHIWYRVTIQPGGKQ